MLYYYCRAIDHPFYSINSICDTVIVPRVCGELRRDLKRLTQGTDEQLRKLINEQDSYLKAKSERQKNFERKILPLQQEIGSLSERKTNLSIAQG